MEVQENMPRLVVVTKYNAIPLYAPGVEAPPQHAATTIQESTNMDCMMTDGRLKDDCNIFETIQEIS
jgi:hypothetical protein